MKHSLILRLNQTLSFLDTANAAYTEYDNERALFYYQKAMNYCFDSSHIRMYIARCFLRLGNFDEARNSYLEAIRIDDKCIYALLGVATIQIQMGNVDSGEEYLNRAYAVDKTNPAVLNQIADYSFKKKLYDKSKQFAIHSLSYTNDYFFNSQSCYILGRTYHVEVFFSSNVILFFFCTILH